MLGPSEINVAVKVKSVATDKPVEIRKYEERRNIKRKIKLTDEGKLTVESSVDRETIGVEMAKGLCDQPAAARHLERQRNRRRKSPVREHRPYSPISRCIGNAKNRSRSIQPRLPL